MFDMSLTRFKLTLFLWFLPSTYILVKSTDPQIYGINCGKTQHFVSTFESLKVNATNIDLTIPTNGTYSGNLTSNLKDHEYTGGVPDESSDPMAWPMPSHLSYEASIYIKNATLKLRTHADNGTGHATPYITGGKIADIRNYPFFALLELQDRRDLTH